MAVASSDVDQLRRERSVADVAAQFGVKLERDGNEWVACCPFHSEDTPSFTVFIGADHVQRYHCFGCGERGDVLDFVQKIKGVGLREAISILGGGTAGPNVKLTAIKVRNAYAGIVPVSGGGEIEVGSWLNLYNPKRAGQTVDDGHDLSRGKFKPEMVFPYRNTDGSLFGYVLRRSLRDGGKETPMVMRVRLPDGEECWSRFPFPKPRPLYRADRISRDQVIVVEGEKCCDAMADVTGRCVVTWAGGTYGIEHADWSPLHGKDVIIWPDADKPGRATAERIAKLIAGKAKRVRIMDVDDKGDDGWDVADAIDDGWTRADVDRFMRDRVREWPAKPAEKPAEAHPLSAGVPDRKEVETAVSDPETGVVIDMRRREDVPSKKTPDAYPDDVPTGGRIPLRDHPKRDDIMALREWIFLSADCVFYNVRTSESMSKTAFDLSMSPITPMVEFEKDDGTTTQKKFPPSKTLIEYLGGEVVSHAMYAPQYVDRFFHADGIRYVNAYLPRTVPAADPDWQGHEAWRVCQAHIENVFTSNAKTLIQWMAHNVQFPGVKILWSPILIGVEGDGKTTVANMLKVAMGRPNVQDVSTEALFSDFNSWAEGACVRVMDEIRVPGERRTAAMNKLKPVITNETVEVVRKGKDGKEIINVTNYIAMSNHLDALALTENDRRWAVMKTRFDSKAELNAAINDEYWENLASAWRDNPGVVRGWLMNVDLSDFNRTVAPAMNDAKRMMIDASRSAIDGDIREALELGGEGIGPAVIATDCLNARMKELGGRSVNTTTLANIMRELGWVRYEFTVKWKTRSRRIYYKPSLIPEGIEGATLTSHLRMLLDETDASGSDAPAETFDW